MYAMKKRDLYTVQCSGLFKLSFLLKYFSSFAAVKLANFTAAKDEKYFRELGISRYEVRFLGR